MDNNFFSLVLKQKEFIEHDQSWERNKTKQEKKKNKKSSKNNKGESCRASCGDTHKHSRTR